jgi:hypothetical protein
MLPDSDLVAELPQTDFGATYRLPGHDRVLPLQECNTHVRDADIRFIEAPHLYIVTQHDVAHQVDRSVTTVAGQFLIPFDGIGVINAMKSSRQQVWPRSGYVHDEISVPQAAVDAGSTLKPGRGVLVHHGGKTLWTMKPCDIRKAGMTGKPIREIIGNRSGLVTTYSKSLIDDEILAKWAANGVDASNRGTEAHFQAEQICNGLMMHPTAEGDLVMRFLNENVLESGAVMYRTEWEIFTDMDAEGIAGSVDLVIQYPDGSLGIVDWKRTPKLSEHLKSFGSKTMLPPLDHLPECDGAKYALQLNTYAWILERYYGFKVRTLTLVAIHPDAYLVTDVPFLTAETEWLMAMERQSNKIARSIADDGLMCEVTGVACTHAMRHRDTAMLVQHGTLYNDSFDHDVAMFDPDFSVRCAVRQRITGQSQAIPLVNKSKFAMPIPCQINCQHKRQKV